MSIALAASKSFGIFRVNKPWLHHKRTLGCVVKALNHMVRQEKAIDNIIGKISDFLAHVIRLQHPVHIHGF